jgi:hypothetical protein
MSTNDDDENDEYMPITAFVKSLSFSRYETAESIASIVVIQAAAYGYISRIRVGAELYPPPTPEDVQAPTFVPLKHVYSFSEMDEYEIENELYEHDIYYENPLHEDEIVFENPLYELDEEIYENPLFEESKSIWDEEENEFTVFVETLKSKLTISDSWGKSHMREATFSGKNLIDVITNQRLSRADAIFIAQSLMDSFVFKSVKVHERTFVDDASVLYQFVEDYSNKSVLNTKPLDFDAVFSPKLLEERVIRKIENLWKVICNEYVKISSKSIVKIGYKLLATSKEWIELTKILWRLHKFDPMILSEEIRKAFFINIYNIMVIHALTLCGRPNSVIARTLFFKTKYYIIGNYKVSLDDIEHIILRGNQNIPHQLFVRCFGTKNLGEISCQMDPRIHFSLHRATVSSPVLRFYDPNNLDEDLDLSARIFLQSQIKMENKVIHLPKLFYLFGDDFGSIKKQLDFIVSNLNDTQKLQFQEIRKIPQFVLQFQPYNWKLNQKEKKEEVLDLRVEFREVVGLLEYRNFFKRFAIREVAEESILCYEAIEKYSLLAKDNERIALAKTIYDTFLVPGAPREINIHQKPVLYVKECIKTQNMKKDVFEEISYGLMDCMVDVYARFQSSPEYQEMILLQMENRMKAATAGPEEKLIGASTMTMKIGQHSNDVIQKRVSPYYTNVFEKYDEWKDSLVIESGFEEVVPDVRQRTSQDKRKTIAIVPLPIDHEEWGDRFSEKMIQKFN